MKHKRRSVAPPKVRDGNSPSFDKDDDIYNLPPGLEDRGVTRGKNGLNSRLQRNNS